MVVSIANIVSTLHPGVYRQVRPKVLYNVATVSAVLWQQLYDISMRMQYTEPEMKYLHNGNEFTNFKETIQFSLALQK